jgi:hypothetical protein
MPLRASCRRDYADTARRSVRATSRRGTAKSATSTTRCRPSQADAVVGPDRNWRSGSTPNIRSALGTTISSATSGRGSDRGGGHSARRRRSAPSSVINGSGDGSQRSGTDRVSTPRKPPSRRRSASPDTSAPLSACARRYPEPRSRRRAEERDQPISIGSVSGGSGTSSRFWKGSITSALSAAIPRAAMSRAER